jgi:hypothetical protein
MTSPEGQEESPAAKYDAAVSYHDSQGRKLPSTPSVLDFSVYRGHMWVATLGPHESAVALQAIQKTIAKWTNSLRGGLAVYHRSGADFDREQREQAAAAEAGHQELVDRLLPSRATAKNPPSKPPRAAAHRLRAAMAKFLRRRS